MNTTAIRYAVLRDRRTWDEGVVTTALQKEADGVLTLASVPGLDKVNWISVPQPFDVEPSGLAIGSHRDLYIADATHNRLIQVGGACDTRMELPGLAGGEWFEKPSALLVVNESLFVADSGNSRLLVFRLPTLELRGVWEGSLQNPIGLAADSQGRVYVLDQGFKQVLRFSATGDTDDIYNAAIASQSVLVSPRFLAIDGQDTLYVSDDQLNSVLRFDSSGKSLDALPLANLAHPSRPRALAARGDRLYVADADTGLIWAFDCVAETYLGTLAAYRGPITALALDEKGKLYIKRGLDETIYQLPADGSFVAKGMLEAGPFDAGELSQWERVHVDVDTPAGTEADLYTYLSDDETAGPGTVADWKKARARDILILPLPSFDSRQASFKRFLWLRVVLRSDQIASPRLIQVEAQTTGESYLNYLPAVYRRDDISTHFLERWLALFRSQLSDWEQLLGEMPARFDPHTAPEDHLPWLAQWLAFEIPAGIDADESRALLQRVHKIYQRRSTPFSIREFVELYAGATPHIFEAFRERRLWQLEHTSRLGFDTVLAAALPDGMIVPGTTVLDPKLMGLKGDYYSGIHFDKLLLSQTNSKVDFFWGSGSPDLLVPPGDFSVRWTGQVRPRYSETYTFHTISDDGVRLWVDGRLIIDNWTDHAPTEDTGRIALVADRWYPIALEFYQKGGGATIKLSWSSRSQREEIVPQERLYSLVDETATTLPSDLQEAASSLIGQAVVGQSGPLAGSDFGAPLFNDTAHLFTVSLPAARLPGSAKRRKLKDVIEQEKPAHTDFHLCFVDAQMRVGFQARIGVDCIIAGPPPPMNLTGVVLGLDSYLGTEESDGQGGRVGKYSRIGQDTILG
jgi:phage tail-like protein